MEAAPGVSSSLDLNISWTWCRPEYKGIGGNVRRVLLVKNSPKTQGGKVHGFFSGLHGIPAIFCTVTCRLANLPLYCCRNKDELGMGLPLGKGASCDLEGTERGGSSFLPSLTLLEPCTYIYSVPYEGSTNPTAGSFSKHRHVWTALVPRCRADLMASLPRG